MDRAKGAPDPPTLETERRQRSKTRAVLSRKARERSVLLRQTSRDLIHISRRLIKQSSQRNEEYDLLLTGN